MQLPTPTPPQPSPAKHARPASRKRQPQPRLSSFLTPLPSLHAYRPKLTHFPPSNQVAKLFADSSSIAITSFISPYKADRASARALHAAVPEGSADEPLPFIEVYVQISVEDAEKRDPKGLYKKARAGIIPEFTGISAPYEEPENPEIFIKSAETPVEAAVQQIVDYLTEKGLLSKA